MAKPVAPAGLFAADQPERSAVNPPAAMVPTERRIDIGAVSDPDQVRAAADWFRRGVGRGLPAEALLMAALAGTAPDDKALNGRTLPSCRSEIYGCLRLTTELPWARRGLQPLAAAFHGWWALSLAWDDLAATLAAEIGPTWPEVDRGRTGFWPDTPRTIARLRQALAQAGQ